MLGFAKHRWLGVGLLAGWVGVVCLGAQTPGTATISGQVHDEEGQPMAGATVILRGLDFELRQQTETTPEGSFSYSGLQPARYHLLLLREGVILWSFPLTLPANQPRLLLEIDLKKLLEAAEQRRTLDPELERRQEEERQRAEREQLLQSHLNRGVRYLREEKPSEALREFQAALNIEPERGSTYAMLGAAFVAAEQPDPALQAYRRALELEPAEGAHHNNLGALLVSTGSLEEALEHFRRAAQLDTDRAARYRFNIGAALLNAGRTEDALPMLQQAIRNDPTLATAHFFLGVALFRTSPRQPTAEAPDRVAGRPGTIEAFERYLQLDPEGEFAGPARDYLEQLGVPASEMLLPTVPAPQDFD